MEELDRKLVAMGRPAKIQTAAKALRSDPFSAESADALLTGLMDGTAKAKVLKKAVYVTKLSKPKKATRRKGKERGKGAAGTGANGFRRTVKKKKTRRQRQEEEEKRVVREREARDKMDRESNDFIPQAVDEEEEIIDELFADNAYEDDEEGVEEITMESMEEVEVPADADLSSEEKRERRSKNVPSYDDDDDENEILDLDDDEEEEY